MTSTKSFSHIYQSYRVLVKISEEKIHLTSEFNFAKLAESGENWEKIKAKYLSNL